MSLCPEGDYRASLSDEDFWAHVFKTDYPDIDESDLDETSSLPMPCPVCGSIEACDYDSEGRPLIHTFPEEYWDDNR